MQNSPCLSILATSRPPFLLLTPCCLLVAVAHVIADNLTLVFPRLLLILMGALAAHISVNMFNEFEDFASGLDFKTRRTPFSGGSGTLPGMPGLASSVRLGAMASLLLTVLIGWYLVGTVGWRLLPIGSAGILLIYFYTTKITHRPLFCLIAPGLAFGPLMICGTYLVLSGHNSPAVFGSSLMVFFLVNNLLLLNQFPDLEADREAGRCHLPILIGRRKSAWVYLFFMFATFASLLANVGLGLLPISSLLGLIPVLLAIPLTARVIKYADDVEALIPALGLNVAVTLLTPVLLAAGVALSA